MNCLRFGSYRHEFSFIKGFLRLSSQLLIKHHFTLIIGTHSQQNLNLTLSHIVKLLKLYTFASIKIFQKSLSQYCKTQSQSSHVQNISSFIHDGVQKLYSHQQCINFKISAIVFILEIKY